MPPRDTTPADDTGSLERLRRRLYAPDAVQETPSEDLSRTTPVIADTGWAPEVPVPPKKSRVSWAALFLVIASVFFIAAIATAAYFLVFGGRSVSTDRVIITPDGPPSQGSGDTYTLLISIENQNPVPITATSLSVEFPDTARAPEDPEKPLSRYADTVGDIEAGATGERSIDVVLFGSENERIVMPIRFEYRIEGSNAVFVKEAEYEIVITSSPISIRAEAVSEASAGQSLTFAVRVRSNAQAPIEHVAVLAEYPFGFTPSKGQGALIPVGRLEPGEERTVTLTGTVNGEDSDERVFRFTVGTRKDEEAKALAVSYSTASAPVSLKKPFLSTTLSLDRDMSASPVITSEMPVQGIISWVNTLATPVLDGRVSMQLSGAALDPASISAYGGYYQSANTTILYSKETEGGLARLAPGDTGGGSFSFSTKQGAALASLRQPTITATISVAGRRVGENNVPENVSSTVVRTMKVATDLALSARSLYSSGPFRNTGPWPPVAEQQTTYTVTLALTNTVNTVADAVVSGTLPSYVTYVGTKSPADAAVTYNPTTRQVVWKAGDVAAGTGYGSAAKTASFQVSLLPSASQRGTSPVLMSGIQASGIDRFTQKQLQEAEPDVTTQTLSDPAHVSGNGEVR